eukprot:g19668.t1
MRGLFVIASTATGRFWWLRLVTQVSAFARDHSGDDLNFLEQHEKAEANQILLEYVASEDAAMLYEEVAEYEHLQNVSNFTNPKNPSAMILLVNRTLEFRWRSFLMLAFAKAHDDREPEEGETAIYWGREACVRDLVRWSVAQPRGAKELLPKILHFHSEKSEVMLGERSCSGEVSDGVAPTSAGSCSALPEDINTLLLRKKITQSGAEGASRVILESMSLASAAHVPHVTDRPKTRTDPTMRAFYTTSDHTRSIKPLVSTEASVVPPKRIPVYPLEPFCRNVRGRAHPCFDGTGDAVALPRSSRGPDCSSAKSCRIPKMKETDDYKVLLDFDELLAVQKEKRAKEKMLETIAEGGDEAGGAAHGHDSAGRNRKAAVGAPRRKPRVALFTVLTSLHIDCAAKAGAPIPRSVHARSKRNSYFVDGRNFVAWCHTHFWKWNFGSFEYLRKFFDVSLLQIVHATAGIDSDAKYVVRKKQQNNENLLVVEREMTYCRPAAASDPRVVIEKTTDVVHDVKNSTNDQVLRSTFPQYRFKSPALEKFFRKHRVTVIPFRLCDRYASKVRPVHGLFPYRQGSAHGNMGIIEFARILIFELATVFELSIHLDTDYLITHPLLWAQLWARVLWGGERERGDEQEFLREDNFWLLPANANQVQTSLLMLTRISEWKKREILNAFFGLEFHIARIADVERAESRALVEKRNELVARRVRALWEVILDEDAGGAERPKFRGFVWRWLWKGFLETEAHRTLTEMKGKHSEEENDGKMKAYVGSLLFEKLLQLFDTLFRVWLSEYQMVAQPPQAASDDHSGVNLAVVVCFTRHRLADWLRDAAGAKAIFTKEEAHERCTSAEKLALYEAAASEQTQERLATELSSLKLARPGEPNDHHYVETGKRHEADWNRFELKRKLKVNLLRKVKDMLEGIRLNGEALEASLVKPHFDDWVAAGRPPDLSSEEALATRTKSGETSAAAAARASNDADEEEENLHHLVDQYLAPPLVANSSITYSPTYRHQAFAFREQLLSQQKPLQYEVLINGERAHSPFDLASRFPGYKTWYTGAVNSFHHLLRKKKLLHTHQMDRCFFGYLGEARLRIQKTGLSILHPDRRQSITERWIGPEEREDGNGTTSEGSSTGTTGRTSTAYEDPSCPFRLKSDDTVLDHVQYWSPRRDEMVSEVYKRCLLWPLETPQHGVGYVTGRCSFLKEPPAVVHKADIDLIEFFRKTWRAENTCGI